MRSPELVATQTLAFLFAYIEGSAAIVQRPGDAYAETLAEYHRVFWEGLAVHGG